MLYDLTIGQRVYDEPAMRHGTVVGRDFDQKFVTVRFDSSESGITYDRFWVDADGAKKDIIRLHV